MATTQSAYPDNISEAVEGMIANTSTCDVDSLVVEDTDGFGWGVACQQGTADNGVKIGIATGKFRGVSVRDRTQDPDHSDKYPKGETAGILWRGDVWVKAEAAVAIGEDVTAKTTTGALSSKVAGTTQIAISGARWMTAAAAGKLARLRLAGPVPAEAA